MVAQSDMRCYAVKVEQLVRRFPPAVIDAIRQFSTSRVAFLESRLSTDSQIRALNTGTGSGATSTGSGECSGSLKSCIGACRLHAYGHGLRTAGAAQKPTYGCARQQCSKRLQRTGHIR